MSQAVIFIDEQWLRTNDLHLTNCQINTALSPHGSQIGVDCIFMGALDAFTLVIDGHFPVYLHVTLQLVVMFCVVGFTVAPTDICQGSFHIVDALY